MGYFKFASNSTPYTIHEHEDILDNYGQNTFFRADDTIAFAKMTSAGFNCTEPPTEGYP
jgi:hypothetical protein